MTQTVPPPVPVLRREDRNSTNLCVCRRCIHPPLASIHDDSGQLLVGYLVSRLAGNRLATLVHRSFLSLGPYSAKRLCGSGIIVGISGSITSARMNSWRQVSTMG